MRIKTTSVAAGAGAADRQADAFTRLYTSERDRLRRVAYLMTGERAVAEEIVHEAFLRVHVRWDRIEAPAGYLRTTVVNLCRECLRRTALARARTPRTQSWVEPPELEEFDETRRLLSGLPYEQRAVLVLRYYEDLSDEQIAELMGCRLATVRTRIHRAIQRLRKEMTP